MHTPSKYKTPTEETVKFILLVALGGLSLYFLISPLISRFIARYTQTQIADFFTSQESSVVNSTCEFIHSKIPGITTATCEAELNPFVNQTLTNIETNADQQIDNLSNCWPLYLSAYSLLLMIIGYAAKPTLNAAFQGVNIGANFLYKKCAGDLDSSTTTPLLTDINTVINSV